MIRLDSAKGGVQLNMLVIMATTLVGILLYLVVVRSNPVLYRYFEKGNPVSQPVFTVFNPFRDRSPEESGHSFLQRLKDQDCVGAMAELSHPLQYQQETCERETTYPLTSWGLRNRTDQPQKISLYYEVSRNNYGTLVGRVWLTMEKRDENWQVTRYDRSYSQQSLHR